MRIVEISNQSHPLAAPLRARVCDTFGSKLRGLSWRRELSAEEGIVLLGDKESRVDSAIHMLGMFFDLAIIWLDTDKRVVDARAAWRWRSILTPRKPAQFVIECGLDRLDEFQLGDQIVFEATP
jgi:uncharacterized membrane protein (UPF0127 family)